MRQGQNDELRHIVDVDGQLIGFPAARVTAAELLLRMRWRDRTISRLVGEIEVPLGRDEVVSLVETDVAFFVTRPPCGTRFQMIRRAA